MARTRFPRSVYSQGSEPDARFTLANERTFLAWVRTGLALLAGGVALEALGLGLHPAFQLSASLLLMAAGTVSALQAWWGWTNYERALRENTPLPNAPLALPLALSVGATGILVVLGVIFR